MGNLSCILDQEYALWQAYRKKVMEMKQRNQHGDILLEAHKIINGERQGQYGTPEDSFQRIADKWNDYIREFMAGRKLTPYDVAYMMFLMKMARIEGGNYVQDSFVDALGYLALAHDMIKKENSNE